MSLEELNRLISDHLIFYGFSVASRIFDTEIIKIKNRQTIK